MALTTFAFATTASVGLQVRQQKKIEKAQKKQAGIERAMQGEEAARRRRSVIREAMIRKAEIENIAGFTGQLESSAPMTTSQDVTGQAKRQLGDVETGLAFAGARTSAQQELFSAQQVSPLQSVVSATQQGAIAFKS